MALSKAPNPNVLNIKEVKKDTLKVAYLRAAVSDFI